MRLPPRTTAIIAMLIVVVTWGSALPVVKPALSLTTPFQFLFYRYIIAAVLSLPILGFFLLKKHRLLKKLPTIIGIELLGTVGALGLLYEGLSRTTALEASLIVTTLPFFITLGGILFLHEKMEHHEWVGLLLALGGTLFLTIEPLLHGQIFSGQISFSGNALVVGHNILMSSALLLAKKKYQKIPKFFVTSISFYLGIFSFGLLSLLKTGLGVQELLVLSWQQIQLPAVFIASGYMALFGSIIGLTAYIIGQSRIEASEASFFTYLEPVVYVPLAVMFLHEPITPGVIIALVAIIAGVMLAEVRIKK